MTLIKGTKKKKKKDSYKRGEITTLIFILLCCDYLFIRQFFPLDFVFLQPHITQSFLGRLHFLKMTAKTSPIPHIFLQFPIGEGCKRS